MITIEYDSEYTKMKLFCYVDTEPEAIDTELMEDAVDLFIAVSGLVTTNVSVEVERSTKPWDELYAGRNIIYARYEPETSNR
jgi:hypothetical protein